MYFSKSAVLDAIIVAMKSSKPCDTSKTGRSDHRDRVYTYTTFISLMLVKNNNMGYYGYYCLMYTNESRSNLTSFRHLPHYSYVNMERQLQLQD